MISNKPIYRTINKLVAQIREEDPDTAITAHFVRKMVADRKILIRKANSKILVNVNSFWDYMSGSNFVKQ